MGPGNEQESESGGSGRNNQGSDLTLSNCAGAGRIPRPGGGPLRLLGFCIAP